MGLRHGCARCKTYKDVDVTCMGERATRFILKSVHAQSSTVLGWRGGVSPDGGLQTKVVARERLCPSWYLLLVAEKIVVVNISNGAFVTDWAIVSLVPR